MYFNVNFNVLFKLIRVHLLVCELYVYQNVRCNDKNFVEIILCQFIGVCRKFAKSEN